MGLVRLILPAVLLIACAFAWAWSYRHNHTVLLCGWEGQINVARSEAGYLSIVVSRHRLAPSDVGILRLASRSRDEVPQKVFGLLTSIRTWGPSDLDAVSYALPPFAEPESTSEPFAAALLAIATERVSATRPPVVTESESHHAPGSLLSVGMMLSWAYPTGLALIWTLLRARPAFQYHRRKRDGLCLHCGYDLRGSPGGCPECGDGREAAPINDKEKRSMRPIRNAVVVVVLMLGAFIAGRTITAPKAPNLSPDVDAQLPVLHDVRRDVRIDRVPLERAIGELSEAYGCEMAADWRSLEEIGIERTTPVTYQGTGSSLSQVLRLLPTGTIDQLDYRLNGTVIVLTSRDDVARYTVTRVYDIDRWLLLREAAKSEGSWEVNSLTWDSPFNPRTPNGSEPKRAAEWLVELIQATIDVGSWQSAGGSSGTLSELDGYLIVRQTPRVHMQIAELLNDLYDSDLKRLKNRDELRRLLDEKAK